MLLLTLALLAAPAALPVAEPQRHVKTRTVRHTRSRARPRTLRTRIALPVLLPSRDPNKRYRVSEGEVEHIDFKTRVVERGAFRNCGVTGMPVCPSKGVPVVKTEE